MDWFMDMTGRGFLVFAISVGIIWHMLKKHSPEVAGTLKQAAGRKAISFITNLFK